MQHHRFSRIVARALPLVILTYLSSSIANATVSKINVADLSRVSAVENVNQSNFVIFGGLAGGACPQNAGSATTTCSNCVKSTTPGDAALIPCNDHRINGSLQVTITFVSTVDGYPAIVPESSTATTPLTTIATSGFTTKGNTASVTVEWRALCATLIVTGGTVSGGTTYATGCNLSGGATATAKFWVGTNPTSGSAPTSDNQADFTVTISGGDVSAGTGPSLATGANGITYFELSSGDSLAEIRNNMRRSTGFPNGPGINFRWVRALFEKRTDPKTQVWTSITPGSPHVDLEVQTSTTDTSNLSLSPVRITSGTGTDSSGNSYSVDLANDSVYDFKLAVVDEAGNVGYYISHNNNGTDSGLNLAEDEYCDSPFSTSPAGTGSGLPECHTARPSAVAGVLANKTNCFVATAAYGSPMASQVDTFRHFRDAYLIPTKLGFEFVRAYYKYGPFAARFIAKSETLRALSRALLWAPLQFAKISMAYGLMAGLASLAAAIAAFLALTFIGKKLATQIRQRRGFRA